jgi:hypothetical protein
MSSKAVSDAQTLDSESPSELADHRPEGGHPSPRSTHGVPPWQVRAASLSDASSSGRPSPIVSRRSPPTRGRWNRADLGFCMFVGVLAIVFLVIVFGMDELPLPN